MLIFNAGGLQLALTFPVGVDFQFPLAADRWFRPNWFFVYKSA